MSNAEARLARQEALHRVLEKHAGVSPTALSQAEAVRIVWHRMVQKLEPVIGARGVEALWTRALHLGAADHPWLGPALGRNTGEGPRLEERSAERVAEAGEALLMSFVDILEGMIGEPLTGRLLNEVWARDPVESSRETLP